ncbi:MAG: acyl carrier protein [Clostridium sp.]|nr:acyl carrier protein [Clostridium sp.]
MILDKIKKIIVEQLGIEEDKITMKTSFKEDLNIDSLDLFQVIMEIEDAFDIQIEDAENIKTVEDAVNYIDSKIKVEK